MPVLTVCIMSLLVTSCASDKDVNKENFTKAINAYLHKQKLCFVVKDSKFPLTIAKDEQLGKDLMDKYNALSDAGLMSRRNEVKNVAGDKMTIRMERAVTYELTATGYRASKRIKNKENKKAKLRQFCFAQPHVTQIKQFSQPVKTDGKTTANVTYLYSVTNVAHWARKKKLLDTFPEVKREIETLNQPVEKKATLVLTKDKWVLKTN